MDIVLNDCLKFAAAYLDDVFIYSESWEEHIQHLKVVLSKIQDAGLTLNANKCSWAQEEVKYLGYLVGQGQIKPQVEKIQAIQMIPRPLNKKQAWDWWGGIPLTELIKQSVTKVIWTDECECAFLVLKEIVYQALVLQSPDFTKPFLVQVDASGVGLGAVLAQGEPGEEKPVL